MDFDVSVMPATVNVSPGPKSPMELPQRAHLAYAARTAYQKVDAKEKLPAVNFAATMPSFMAAQGIVIEAFALDPSVRQSTAEAAFGTCKG